MNKEYLQELKVESVGAASDGGSLIIVFSDINEKEAILTLDRSINARKKNYFYFEIEKYLNLSDEIIIKNVLEDFIQEYAFSTDDDITENIIKEFIKVITERET